jgi:hypothetical protein
MMSLGHHQHPGEAGPFQHTQPGTSYRLCK